MEHVIATSCAIVGDNFNKLLGKSYIGKERGKGLTDGVGLNTIRISLKVDALFIRGSNSIDDRYNIANTGSNKEQTKTLTETKKCSPERKEGSTGLVTKSKGKTVKCQTTHCHYHHKD